MKKSTKIFLTVIILLALLLFFIRLTSPKEIDDIHPLRPCEENYIEKSDTLWIIPKYQNYPISKNQTWCKEILKTNKILGMHGIYHSYHEFKYKINETELIETKQIFEKCFGYEPTLFKPPYLKLSKENKELLKKHNLEIKLITNQNTHKVYHCQNSGFFPNWFHDIF
jgi:predicted deacetylase